MIQINLLPPEYRRPSGTPGARFVAIVAGLVLVLAAGGFFAYTHFIHLVNAQELRDARQSETQAKERLRDRSLALQAEIDTYVKRRRAIQTINRSRTLWSKKLDQLFDIVTTHGAEQPIVAWLQSIVVPTQTSAAGSGKSKGSKGKSKKSSVQPAGKLEIAGSLAVEEDTDGPAVMASLHRALTGDIVGGGGPTEFYSDFMSISNPGLAMERNNEDVDLVPPHRGTFRLEMLLQPINLDAKVAPTTEVDLEEIEAALWDESFTYGQGQG